MRSIIDTSTVTTKVAKWNALVSEIESFLKETADDISFIILTRG